jgi:peptide/nickel transport system permease protein
MRTYILKRVLQIVPTVLMITFVVFVMMRSVPGDPVVAAILTRLLRASMLEVIRTEYVTTARAKGLSERPVVFKHALKNALIPTVTVMGLQVGFLIGGAIVVETLFAMPGLGTFGIDAIVARDYQQVQGFALITALAFVVINLLVDLTYTFLDPRIRYA